MAASGFEDAVFTRFVEALPPFGHYPETGLWEIWAAPPSTWTINAEIGKV